MTQRQLYSGLDLYDWRGTGPNGRTKAVDVDKWQQNQEDIRHLPGAFPVQNVVITDGQITPTAAALTVDTEGGTPADDLTAIAPGDLHEGMLLALCSVDTGRKVTIKSSAGASGIQTLDGKDVVLDTQYAVMLRLVSTESLTLWREEPGPLRLQLTVSTPDTLGGVKVQTGDDDGLEMIGDKLRARQATATQRGSVLASVTAAAGATPLGGVDGTLDKSWVPTPPITLFNSRTVITKSNAAWTPPVTGWARVTVIGGGGGGGAGGVGFDWQAGRGGAAGGVTTFGNLTASGGCGGGGAGAGDVDGFSGAGGGGGGAGKVLVDYVYLNKTPINVVIGAGGAGGRGGNGNNLFGTDGSGPYGGKGGTKYVGGAGGKNSLATSGAGSRGCSGSYAGLPGTGGHGGITGIGYGGGGGGGGGYCSNNNFGLDSFGSGADGGEDGSTGDGTNPASGGDGGAGAVIIEYYNPAKEGA